MDIEDIIEISSTKKVRKFYTIWLKILKEPPELYELDVVDTTISM